MKNNKGITLVSMVVTVLIMLILVTVSVNMITSDTGIIKKSKEAALESEISDVRDVLDEAQSEFLLKRARGYNKSNEEFLIEKGYLEENTGKLLLQNIIDNPKTGKGDISVFKDVYAYLLGGIYYFDKDGNKTLMVGVEINGSLMGIKFEKVVSKGNHVLAIDMNGDLWGWGYNEYKQVADVDENKVTIARRIDIGKKVRDCKVTGYGSVALDVDGNIWTWGKDQCGELGRGVSGRIYPTPKQITNGIKFEQISAASYNVCAIDENGILYGCGGNKANQLNGIDKDNRTTIVMIENSRRFKQVELGENYYTGEGFLMAIDSENVVWTRGENYTSGSQNAANNTSLVSIKDNVKKVQIARRAIFLLTNDGDIWSCGEQSYGELALGTSEAIYTLTKVNSQKKFIDIDAKNSALVAIDTEGEYWASGFNMYGSLLTGYTGDEGYLKKCDKLNRINNIKYVCIANCNAFCIDGNGNLFCLGWNGYGQLANGKVDSSWLGASYITKVVGYNGDFVKIAAGEREGLGIDSNGDVYTWGYNWNNECGYSSNRLNVNEPTRIPNLKAKEISSGCSFSGLIDTEGNLFMCGDNTNGDLGTGQGSDVLVETIVPVQIMSGTKFSKISCGQANSYAIDVDGNLWAWGRNSNGELGDGTKTQRNSPVQIATGTKFKEIAAGTDNSFALDKDGYLWSTGRNSYGALGNGNYTSITTLTKVSDGRKYSKIAGFHETLIAIDEQGNAYTCGENGCGQLGDGTYNKRNVLTQVMNGTKFKACASSWDNTYLVDTNGNLWGSGDNSFGQLGVPYTELEESTEFIKVSNNENIVDVASTGGNYIALDADGNIYAGGYNEYTQCTKVLIPDDYLNIVKIKKDVED